MCCYEHKQLLAQATSKLPKNPGNHFEENLCGVHICMCCCTQRPPAATHHKKHQKVHNEQANRARRQPEICGNPRLPQHNKAQVVTAEPAAGTPPSCRALLAVDKHPRLGKPQHPEAIPARCTLHPRLAACHRCYQRCCNMLHAGKRTCAKVKPPQHAARNGRTVSRAQVTVSPATQIQMPRRVSPATTCQQNFRRVLAVSAPAPACARRQPTSTQH